MYFCLFFLKEVKLSKEDVEDWPLNRTVQVDSFCSSDNSCDSSQVSSDLEVGWSPVGEQHDIFLQT